MVSIFLPILVYGVWVGDSLKRTFVRVCITEVLAGDER
jgi:hypothetical protein